jgi:hypothetical protein
MKSKYITITRAGQPIKMFTDWWEAGTWCDENIKSDFELYYFDKHSKIKTFLFKIHLFLFG